MATYAELMDRLLNGHLDASKKLAHGVEKLVSRDRKSGKYAHSSMEVKCVCGHELGKHSAESVGGIRECFVDGCDCEKFRKSRK